MDKRHKDLDRTPLTGGGVIVQPLEHSNGLEDDVICVSFQLLGCEDN